MRSWLPNLLGYQLVWVSAVGGAAVGWWWSGPLACAAFAALHLLRSRQRAVDLRLMSGCLLLGIAVDSLWVQVGWIRFEAAVPSALLAPLWILAIWAALGLTLNHSLASLQRHLRLASALGMLAGPLAYHVAARVWHAAELAGGAHAYVGLAVGWAVLTPVLLQWAATTRRHAPRALARPA